MKAKKRMTVAAQMRATKELPEQLQLAEHARKLSPTESAAEHFLRGNKILPNARKTVSLHYGAVMLIEAVTKAVETRDADEIRRLADFIENYDEPRYRADEMRLAIARYKMGEKAPLKMPWRHLAKFTEIKISTESELRWGVN